MNFYERNQKVMAYALLPGIVPRVREALGTPLAFLSALMADVLVMAALLPKGHPFTQDSYFGQYRVIDVLRVGWGNVRFRWQNLDQIVVMAALGGAYVAFWLMVILMIASFVQTAAFAQGNFGTSTASLMANIYQATATPYPEKDMALMMLDRTLGVVGSTPSGSFFGSDVPRMCLGGDIAREQNPQCPALAFPSPFNQALLALLQFYATAIFAFGVLLFLYLLMVVVMDTAMKGKPISEKINSFWTPLRLAAAIGLMIPLAPQGLNSAQYIVLHTAKVGSAFATNAWMYYHGWLDRSMGAPVRNPIGAASYPWVPYDPALGERPQLSSPLAAKLNAPDVSSLVRFLHLVAACDYYYERTNPGMKIEAYFISPNKDPKPAYQPSGQMVSYEDALDYFNNQTIRIMFGHYDPVKYPKTKGFQSFCGELVVPVQIVKPAATVDTGIAAAALVHKNYYRVVMTMMDSAAYSRQLMDGFAMQMVENYAQLTDSWACRSDFVQGDMIINHPRTGENLEPLGECNKDPPSEYMDFQISWFQTNFQMVVNGANAELAKPENFRIDNKIIRRGWAGAGLWLQHIAQINGQFVSTVQQMPYGRDPEILSWLRSILMKARPHITNPSEFCAVPSEAGKNMSPEQKELTTALCRVQVYLYAEQGDTCFKVDPKAPPTVGGMGGYLMKCQSQMDNFMLRMMKSVLGLQFIFDFRENSDTHPFARLVTFGRSLIETTLQNVMQGSMIAAGSGLISLGNTDVGGGLRKVSSAYLAVASMLFSAGFMLYYVLPMYPFIYFFFGMMAWVKAVFEGLVGAPLWAVAHVNLDGDGFGSKRSRNGYLLLLEILLRPIIVLFALLAALGIFAGIIHFLDDTFDLALMGMGRPDLVKLLADQGRNVDTFQDLMELFFFTILYIFIIYTVATSTFKLIDKIPAGMMRWFGGDAGSFAKKADSGQAAAGQFSSNAYVAVGNPLRDVVDKIDDWAAGFTNAGAQIADNASGGAVKAMIQNAVGPDRETRVQQAFQSSETGVGGMAKGHAEAAKNAKTLEAAIAEATEKKAPAEEIDNLKKQLEMAKVTAAINDPELVYKEAMQMGSAQIDFSKIPAAERAALEAQFREHVDQVQKLVRDYRTSDDPLKPTVYDSLASKLDKFEAKSDGPPYGVTSEQVSANIEQRIKAIKQAAIKKATGKED